MGIVSGIKSPPLARTPPPPPTGFTLIGALSCMKRNKHPFTENLRVYSRKNYATVEIRLMEGRA